MLKFILLTLLPTVAMAFPVPKELEGAVITVTTRDSKIYKFSANEYKVVRRTIKKPLALKPELPVTEVIRTEVVEQRHASILSVYAVQGQHGLDFKTNGNTTEVSTVNRVGLGAMYQQRLGDIYMGFGGDSNRNLKVMFGVGL